MGRVRVYDNYGHTLYAFDSYPSVYFCKHYRTFSGVSTSTLYEDFLIYMKDCGIYNFDISYNDYMILDMYLRGH